MFDIVHARSHANGLKMAEKWKTTDRPPGDANEIKVRFAA